ncbi:MAG TPA: HAD-IIA family hydrolase [Acidimicrobiales bacterium]
MTVAAGALVCDLDGVVWLADAPIAGSAAAVDRWRSAGGRALFVTNNSYAPIAEVEAKLARFGIPAEGDVLGSAEAAATLVRPGERVLLCGGPGARQVLERARVVLVPAEEVDRGAPVDVVVVGFHRSFDYEVMRVASGAVRAGARFIATNDDATYPTPTGPIPGCGSIVAGIAQAAGRVPQIAGKPYAPMAALVRAVLGAAVADAVVVGDRADTDGRLALAIGARFALVLSGVTTASDGSVEPAPDVVAADLAGVVDRLLTTG